MIASPRAASAERPVRARMQGKFVIELSIVWTGRIE